MLHSNKLTVVVDVATLIDLIKTNLACHKAAVLKARAGFEKEAEEVLSDKLALLRKGETGRIYISLSGVDDHSQDYGRVIGMLSMHIGGTIEIGSEDYARYVQDDWDWKEAWVTANSKYLGT